MSSNGYLYIKILQNSCNYLKKFFDLKYKYYYFIKQIHLNIKIVIADYKISKITNKNTFYFISKKMVIKFKVENCKKHF